MNEGHREEKSIIEQDHGTCTKELGHKETVCKPDDWYVFTGPGFILDPDSV